MNQKRSSSALFLFLRSYLFWVGFATLGGAFLKLDSTAFLGWSFMVPVLIVLVLAETETCSAFGIFNKSLLDRLPSLLGKISIICSSWHRQKEEHRRISNSNSRTKRAPKVVLKLMIFIIERCWYKWRLELEVLVWLKAVSVGVGLYEKGMQHAYFTWYAKSLSNKISLEMEKNLCNPCLVYDRKLRWLGSFDISSYAKNSWCENIDIKSGFARS